MSNEGTSLPLRLLLMSGVCFCAMSFGTAAAQGVDPEGDAVEAENAEDAEETDEKVEEVVVVRGVRASERAAVETKYDADQIVDAVTAQDIGELPERSIAETLELLPGVTGNRNRGRSDTISVRGIGGEFTLVTLNGREIVSSYGARSVNLSLYPSSAIRRGLVYKTPLPEQIAGGTGGSIDMQTLRPLEVNNDIRTLSVAGLYNESAADVRGYDGFGHDINGTFSKRFGDKFAVAISASTLSEQFSSQEIQIGGIVDTIAGSDWNGNGQADEGAPGFTQLSPSYREEERDAIFGTLQWRPVSNLNVTFDALYSEFEYTETVAGLSIGFIDGGGTGGGAVLDSVILDDGSVIAGASTSNTVTYATSEIYNYDQTEAYGLNVDYALGDWTLVGDLSYSTSDRSYSYNNASSRAGTSETVVFDFQSQPDITLLFPETDLTATNFPFLTLSDNLNTLTDEITAVKFDVSRDMDFAIFDSFKFGVRASEREKTFDKDAESFGQNTALGFAVTDFDVSTLNVADFVLPFAFSDPFPNFDHNIPAEWIMLDRSAALAALGYDGSLRDLDRVDAAPDSQKDALRRAYVADLISSYNIQEEVLAAYAQTEFSMNIGQRALSGVLGVRVEKTELDSSGYAAAYDLQAFLAGGNLRPTGEALPVDASNSYTDVLPSLNLTYELSRQFLIRAAAGRVMTRPLITDLGPNTTIQLGDSTFVNFENGASSNTAGNPMLEPIRTDQFDVSFEYYPRAGEIFSVAYFYKDMDGFYEPSIQQLENEAQGVIGNPANQPPTLPFVQPVKVDGGKVSGLELTMRKELRMLPGWLSNLTISGNYTIMDFDGFHQDFNVELPTNAYSNESILDRPEGFIEETYNIGLSYDDGKRLSWRLNYNGQSDAPMVNTDGSNERWRRDNQLLNGSINYRINDNFTALFQVTNILDEVDEYGQLGGNQALTPRLDFPRQLEASGRRFRLGVRASF